MDWKDYSEQPDEGLFEKIQQRLRVRRMWRVSGAVTAAVAVVAVGGMLLLGGQNQEVAEQPLVQVAQSEPIAQEAQSVPAVQEAQSAPAAQRVQVAQSTPSTPTATSAQSAEVAQSTQSVQVAEALPQEEPDAEALASIASSSSMASMPSIASSPSSTSNTSYTSHTSNTSYTSHTSSPSPTSNTSFASPAQQDTLPEVKKTVLSVLRTPNIIVPDGDEDGLRYFGVTATEEIDNFTIRIYNRRGQQVFVSKDKSFKWDGSAEGRRVPQGAYVWVATYRDSHGQPHNDRGTVTVVR